MLFKDQKVTFAGVFVLESVGKILKDRPYGPRNFEKYDLYFPKKQTDKMPILLDLQGGGLVRGRKSSEKLSPMLRLTEQGIAITTMNYCLISEKDYAFPKQVAEVRAVLIDLKKHAQEWGLDLNRIYLTGESSGAQLAVLTAATVSAGVKLGYADGLEDDVGQVPTIQKVIASYGPYEFDQFKEEFQQAGIQPKYKESGEPNSFEGLALGGHQVTENPIGVSQGNPANYFTKEMPALFAMAGTADQVVPFQQSVEMVKRYEALTGKQAKTYWLTGGHHGIADFDNEQVDQMKIAFLKA
ncbi:alpha/beta hydrolase [Fructobacillus parabroussonetiae]|uniref:Alpha/beta hydrolase n=1 Tax=Fructobacillus parabroussonetiae TaxID=2713174 RepID=A0ABS5QUP6_9LACO|nr:alpha/beta hydrolase [Fructobacillus parabroussonetiae]MBS9336870.1 alpha/beta hydrolase [Fructobacillus parabroussonetiae]